MSEDGGWAPEQEGVAQGTGRRSNGGGSAKRTRPGRAARWLIAIGVLALATSPLWGPIVFRRLDFFRVRRVEIVGAHYVVPGDILSRLHVDTMASVWDPTDPLVARVAAHPGVGSVAVRRKLPGTLVVEIVERVPVALVPAGEGFRVYDARGTALPIDPARVAVDAPVLMQADVRLLRLLSAVREQRPEFYARVSTLRRVGKDELLFQLGNLPVRTMQDVSVERLDEIEPVEGDLRRKHLLAAEIDLRYRDQVIARLQ